MSTSLNKSLTHHDELEKDTALHALNLFIDGELTGASQPALFKHLSICASCRRELDGVINFRRISREENLLAPPGLDQAMFKRLNKHKTIMTHIDRAEERRPLWNMRTHITLRATILTALMVFMTGLLMPHEVNQKMANKGSVTGSDELIEFFDGDLAPANTRTLYVFYPGLTIEASSDPYDDQVMDTESP